MTSEPLAILSLRAAAGNDHTVLGAAAQCSGVPDEHIEVVEELTGDADVFGFSDPLLSASMAAALVIFLAGRRGARPPHFRRLRRRRGAGKGREPERPDDPDPPTLTPRMP